MTVVIDGTTGISGVDGTASSPAIEGTDSNTGIFFPAADTIAFAEGGVEVARFDSAGNFGIGTSTPISGVRLTVEGNFSCNGNVMVGGGTSAASTNLTGGTTFNTNGAAIALRGSTAGFNNHGMEFYAGGSERMRLDSSGNVGIGTSSPTAKIDVAPSSGAASIYNRAVAGQNAVFDLAGGGNTVGSTSFQLSQLSDSSAYVFQRANSALVFGTNNTERMRIDSGGRVTTPSQPFFLGAPTNDYAGGGMPTGFIPFTAIHNNGSCYNAGNSRFTAPVSGWYQTTWGGLQLPATVTSLSRNGVRLYNGNHFPSGVAYINMTQTAVVFLNANDYLNIEGWNGGGYYRDWYLWSVSLIG